MTTSRPTWLRALGLAVALLAGLAVTACALGLPDSKAMEGKTLERARTINGYE